MMALLSSPYSHMLHVRAFTLRYRGVGSGTRALSLHRLRIGDTCRSSRTYSCRGDQMSTPAAAIQWSKMTRCTTNYPWLYSRGHFSTPRVSLLVRGLASTSSFHISSSPPGTEAAVATTTTAAAAKITKTGRPRGRPRKAQALNSVAALASDSIAASPPAAAPAVSTTATSSSATSTTAATATAAAATSSTGKTVSPGGTLFVVDGTSMLYTAYFAAASYNNYSSSAASKGKTKSTTSADSGPRTPTSVTESETVQHAEMLSFATMAVSNVALSLARLVRDFRPEYLVLALDRGRSNFRHAAFAEYKAGRPKTPSGLSLQFAHLKRMCEALGVAYVSAADFEADDVMASVGKIAIESGLDVVHVSPDKDMLQLLLSPPNPNPSHKEAEAAGDSASASASASTSASVQHSPVEPKVRVLRSATAGNSSSNRRMWAAADVVEKYGVRPESLVDYLALSGDAADGIEGVKGIGPSAAAHLLNHFGSIEKIFDAVHAAVKPFGALSTAELEEWKLKLPSGLGPDQYTIDITGEALASIRAAGVRSKPERSINLLLACGRDRALLFKRLITLRDDIDLNAEAIELFSPVDATLCSMSNTNPASAAIAHSSPHRHLERLRFVGPRSDAETMLASLAEAQRKQQVDAVTAAAGLGNNSSDSVDSSKSCPSTTLPPSPPPMSVDFYMPALAMLRRILASPPKNK